MDRNRLLQRLNERRFDSFKNRLIVNEGIVKTASSDLERYMLTSMQEVDAEYTQKTFNEAGRVQKHLIGPLDDSGYDISFDYQGSVTNNTHIRIHSDIDVLVITERYVTLEPPLKPLVPYKGDPIDDLSNIRRICIQAIRDAFPKVTVDDSKSKSVGLSGGSLERDIDLVPANWFNTVDYNETHDKTYRGIQVLDNKKKERTKNYPFLHNYRVIQKDLLTNGNSNKLVRFLKSIKADAITNLSISSYDIIGLVYNMPDQFFPSSTWGHERDLLLRFGAWASTLKNNEGNRKSLLVPHGKRDLFSSDGLTVTQLGEMLTELDSYLVELFGIAA